MEYVNLGRSGLKVSRARLGGSFDAFVDAIAWCLTRRGVTSAIIGPRTLGQMNECLEVMELTLPGEALKALSDVSRPRVRR